MGAPSSLGCCEGGGLLEENWRERFDWLEDDGCEGKLVK